MLVGVTPAQGGEHLARWARPWVSMGARAPVRMTPSWAGGATGMDTTTPLGDLLSSASGRGESGARRRLPRETGWRGPRGQQRPGRPDCSGRPGRSCRGIPLLRVREGGVEPPRPFGHTDLNRARLPIPPLALEARSGYPTGPTRPKPTQCRLGVRPRGDPVPIRRRSSHDAVTSRGLDGRARYDARQSAASHQGWSGTITGSRSTRLGITTPSAHRCSGVSTTQACA